VEGKYYLIITTHTVGCGQ